MSNFLASARVSRICWPMIVFIWMTCPSLAQQLTSLPPFELVTGKSQLIKLNEPISRISIGNPDIADVMLINSKEIYLLGKKQGTTNLITWSSNGMANIHEVAVAMDLNSFHSKIKKLIPELEDIGIDVVSENMVLTGKVSDAMKANRLVTLSEAFSGGKKIINLLRIEGSQQVMLEVKVAEVSKTLLEDLGVDINLTRTVGGTSINVLSQLLSNGSSSVSFTRANGLTNVTITADMKKSLVKILAEPTITAVSGQEGSFLAGGKIFIPVPQSSSVGATVITLEEKEFGVGIRFLPTVLEDGLINLRVTPEVSELSQTGTMLTSLTGQSTLLPSITTRRASTTVQLRTGESFAIGGLIKNNVSESIKAVPFLGEIPILGALFRSSAFQTERSELLFIVTPRLAQPVNTAIALPTDSFIPPTRLDRYLHGNLEGQAQSESEKSSGSEDSANTANQKP
jgi:pilus assembly protein CpaC